MSEGATSAEEAAAKAREIAAKLMGTTMPISTSTTSSTATATAGSKRKRWGVAAPAPAELPGLESMTKKLQQEAEPIQKRLWITSSVSKERPAWHFVSYMSPHFPAIIDKVSAIAKTDPQDLTVSFKGRGSSRQPAQLGIPEEPLHVFVQGPREAAEEAEAEIEILLQQAESAEVTIDISQEPEYKNQIQAEELNDRQLALVGASGSGSGHGSYRPATVAQLIGGNATFAASSNVPMGEWPSEEVHGTYSITLPTT
jgi:hypothetical protein